MTGANPGAAPDGVPPWTERELTQARSIVRRLQQRIVKAVQQKRWRKVRALQHLLTHSRSAKVLAVQRVTENRGKHTPGVDGVTWNTPAAKRDAVASLRPRGYQPQPLRRCYIPKKNGKLRPLGIPTMQDRAMQALYLQALDPIAETLGDPHSYGFRPARSCADALEQCHIVLSNSRAAEWVLEGDIQACFDRISHAWLLAHVPLDRTMLRKWLAAGYLEQTLWHPTEAGTPQGGIISPVLANLALDGLQARLARAFPRTRAGCARVNLIRYADDFVITGRSQEQLEIQVRPLVEDFLAERGLTLSPEKTSITRVTDGFDFLGQNIRRYGKKVLCKPSRRSLRLFYAGVRQVIHKHRHVDPATLIQLLNPKIEGWTRYHRHGTSKKVFQRIDHLLFGLLWRWCKRRHPRKSAHWVADRYFTTVGGNHWVFHGWEHRPRGEVRHWLLAVASSTRIIRHVKVRCELNAYAPEWAEYLARRRTLPWARGYPALGDSAIQEAEREMRRSPTSAPPE
ncbi:MAG: group II intron reverse transcriptase/maturase [Actinomycetota bacterium]